MDWDISIPASAWVIVLYSSDHILDPRIYIPERFEQGHGAVGGNGSGLRRGKIRFTHVGLGSTLKPSFVRIRFRELNKVWRQLFVRQTFGIARCPSAWSAIAARLYCAGKWEGSHRVGRPQRKSMHLADTGLAILRSTDVRDAHSGAILKSTKTLASRGLLLLRKIAALETLRTSMAIARARASRSLRRGFPAT